MSENKVLVKIIVPELDKSYDILIPINRKVGNVIELVNKIIKDLNEDDFEINDSRYLYDKYTGFCYEFNSLIVDTNIRNDSVLIFV